MQNLLMDWMELRLGDFTKRRDVPSLNGIEIWESESWCRNFSWNRSVGIADGIVVRDLWMESWCGFSGRTDVLIKNV